MHRRNPARTRRPGPGRPCARSRGAAICSTARFRVSSKSAALSASFARPRTRAETPLPPTGRPIVIVLPFDKIGGDPEQGYFADGLTADLVTDLTRFQGCISPVHRASRITRLYPPLDAVAEALPAALVIFGGAVRRAGGRLRITVG